MPGKPNRLLTPLFWIVCWCVFTTALVIWWIIFASELVAYLIEQAGKVTDDYIIAEYFGKQNMLFWEGITLVVLLLIGGAALVYYVWRVDRQNRQIREFFSAFTHELKTPIASLQLQAESLREDMTEPQHLKLVERLLKDAQRLQLRFDNSLYYANLDRLSIIHPEWLSLHQLLVPVQESYPELRIEASGNCRLFVDRAAFEAVLKNLASNALIHARANTLFIQTSMATPDEATLLISDNGSGFAGDRQKIGQLFARHNRQSGSGLGLYLVRTLVAKMGGNVQFNVEENRQFIVQIRLRAKP